MNYHLTQIPERTAKPRKSGLTMVMDKGLSYGEAENFLSVAGPHIDVIKLGFGTSFVTPNLRKKLNYIKRRAYLFISVVLYLKPL